MIRSMTGYARHEATTTAGTLVWEVRAVNHRYLDLQLRLPEDFRVLETELRASAGSRLGRGKVEATLAYKPATGSDTRLEVDIERLRALKAALDVVTSEMSSFDTPDPMRILAWPGVLNDSSANHAVPLTEAEAAFASALKGLDDSRTREGERLAAHLRERTDGMRTLVARVRERAPQVRDAWVERLRQRCADLGVDVEPQRLAQEVALAAQKLDVDEEMSRLAGHLDEIEAVLRRDEAVGRRLDFLMQELNRETNTLGSKAQDEELTRCAVEMKVLIEQMREQVQNIE